MRGPTQPKPPDVAPDERDAYDAVIARESRVFGHEPDAEGNTDVGPYWGALLNSPPMCAIAAQMGTFIRSAGERPGTYSHADREFVDQVLSADWKTNVVQGIHIADAVREGVRVEAIEALREGREDELNEDERLLASYIRKVVSGQVDDDTYSAMERRLGTRGLVEYTGFILWLQWIMRMMQALGTPAISEQEAENIIAELRENGASDRPQLANRYA